LGKEHPDVAKSLYLVGDRLREEGKLNEAATFLNEALAMQRNLLKEDSPTTLDTLRSIGLVLESEGKLSEAEQVHREALNGWRKRGETEVPQALNEAESLAGVLKAEQKFDDAEQLLDEVLTPAVRRQPAGADLLVLRANLEAGRGEWQEAAADTAQAFEDQPLNYDRYSIMAALLIKTHNRPAYELLRQRLLAMSTNTTNIYFADQVAKACLFLPPSAADLPKISHLADMTVTLGAGNEGAMPFFEICKALSEYRQGHYAGAVEWAQKSIKSPRIDAHGHAYAVLAMADWQLGEKDEARAMLAEGNALRPAILPVRDAEDPRNAWQGWLFARTSLDEAAALIQPASTAGNRPNGPP
jgi:tetratricopeptide (TPR) repeat protein